MSVYSRIMHRWLGFIIRLVPIVGLLLFIGCVQSAATMESSQNQLSTRDIECRTLVITNKMFSTCRVALGYVNEDFFLAVDMGPDESALPLIEVDKQMIFVWDCTGGQNPNLPFVQLKLEKTQYDLCMSGDDANLPYIDILPKTET